MNLKINHLAKKFQDDGFVIVKNFLEKSAVDELEREINRYILKILPTVPKIHVVYESGWSGPLKQFSRMELYDRYFKKILNRPATLKLLEACLGEPAEPPNHRGLLQTSSGRISSSFSSGKCLLQLYVTLWFSPLDRSR